MIIPIQLRDYQIDLLARTGQALRRVQSVLMQCPPGGGKTGIGTDMLTSAARRGSAGWFICHRVELIEQTSNTFTRYGLQHGIIAPWAKEDLSQLVQICSINTLKNRLEYLTAPKFALIDEAHHSGAAGWILVIEWLKAAGTYIIGLSGTPRRHDGSGLGAQYDELVPGPTVPWLMEHGHLSQYDIYAPDKPDMRGVPKRMGRYSDKETVRRVATPRLTGNIINHWREHAQGKLTVGFGFNVAHSEYLAEQFVKAGIRAIHLDGKTKKAERRAQIADFGSGGIEVIFNVSLFGEGFDLSAIAQRDITIDAVIDVAPGESLPWYLQKVMRSMRPGPVPGKTAIILDHANNSDKMGFPDDPHIWTLDGTKGQAANDNAPPPPITCEGCYRQIRRPAPECCPTCGKLLRDDWIPPQVADGVLKKKLEEDKRKTRQRLAFEQAQCQSLGELADLFRRRGHKNPVGHAGAVYGARRRKQQS